MLITKNQIKTWVDTLHDFITERSVDKFHNAEMAQLSFCNSLGLPLTGFTQWSKQDWKDNFGKGKIDDILSFIEWQFIERADLTEMCISQVHKALRKPASVRLQTISVKVEKGDRLLVCREGRLVGTPYLLQIVFEKGMPGVVRFFKPRIVNGIIRRYIPVSIIEVRNVINSEMSNFEYICDEVLSRLFPGKEFFLDWAQPKPGYFTSKLLNCPWNIQLQFSKEGKPEKARFFSHGKERKQSDFGLYLSNKSKSLGLSQ